MFDECPSDDDGGGGGHNPHNIPDDMVSACATAVILTLQQNDYCITCGARATAMHLMSKTVAVIVQLLHKRGYEKHEVESVIEAMMETVLNDGLSMVKEVEAILRKAEDDDT